MNMLDWLYKRDKVPSVQEALKKGKDMAKKSFEESLNETSDTGKITIVKPNYTRFLVGTYLDLTHGWMICSAPFDPVTGQIGELQKERAAGDIEVMRERLMIKEVNLGLFSSDPITQEKKEEIY